MFHLILHFETWLPKMSLNQYFYSLDILLEIRPHKMTVIFNLLENLRTIF